MIKFSLQNIPLLIDYLRFAYFAPVKDASHPQHYSYDKEKGEVSIQLSRVCYEKPFYGKVLLCIPIVRHKRINCKLLLNHVKNVKTHYEWPEDYMGKLLWYQSRIEGIFLDQNKELYIGADVLSLDILLSEDSEIVIEDISQPSDNASEACWLGRKPWKKLKEINKLREPT